MAISSEALAYYVSGASAIPPQFGGTQSTLQRLDAIKVEGVPSNPSEFMSTLNETFMILHGGKTF